MSFRRDLPHNSARVTWAHAVNDKAFLKSSLNSDILMIEADILMGKLSDGKELQLPIMAHPPNLVSDLSLLEFVTIVDDFNKLSPFKKGIKLDFKSITAFEAAISSELFIKTISEANYPVWLNADILEGPLTPIHIKPVDAARFLKGGKLFPQAVLSLGWTTGFNSSERSSYTSKNVEEMLNTLEMHEVRQPITFAVRAGLVAESHDQIKSLLRNNDHTITVWSGVNDKGFNVSSLNTILDSIESRRIYIDVPHELRIQLNIVNPGSNATNVIRS